MHRDRDGCTMVRVMPGRAMTGAAETCGRGSIMPGAGPPTPGVGAPKPCNKKGALSANRPAHVMQGRAFTHAYDFKAAVRRAGAEAAYNGCLPRGSGG